MLGEQLSVLSRIILNPYTPEDIPDFYGSSGAVILLEITLELNVLMKKIFEEELLLRLC